MLLTGPSIATETIATAVTSIEYFREHGTVERQLVLITSSPVGCTGEEESDARGNSNSCVGVVILEMRSAASILTSASSDDATRPSKIAGK